MWWLVGVAAVAAGGATYLIWMVARIDRLHARAASAGKALDAHLMRRAAAAAVLADRRGVPELYVAARAALDARPDDREAAENDLTRRLRQVLTASEDRETLAVVSASRRVALARQVHSDLVRDARTLRRHPLVRLLRLSRRHPAPLYFDVDDPTLEQARLAA